MRTFKIIVMALLISAALLLTMRGAYDVADRLTKAYEVSRVQALMDGPTPLVIECHEERRNGHALICAVNAPIRGLWVIREYIDGRPMGGVVANVLTREFELRIGSDVVPELKIEFFTGILPGPLSLDFTMDTSYLRQGIRNFIGPRA